MTRSQKIIAEVARRHHMEPRDILARDRSAIVVAARREAVRLMMQAKMTTAVISTALGLNRSTILFHAHPDRAQRRKDEWARKNQAERLAKRPHDFRVKIRPEYLPKLAKLAALTDASVEAAVNQAVSDMLEAA